MEDSVRDDEFPALRDLYPEMSDEELEQLEEIPDRYLEIVLRQ